MKFAIAMTISMTAVTIISPPLTAREKSPASTKSVASTVQVNRQKLWLAGVAAPRDDKNSSELKELIARVKALDLSRISLKPKQVKPIPAVVAVVAPTSQPAEKATARSAESKVKEPKPATSEKTDSILAQAKLLEKISKLDPKKIDSPGVMAEALFLAGRPDIAAKFYEAAAENETDEEDIAWLLFQAGNCWRKEDPKTALKIFTRLIDGHGESMWATIARSQKAIIQWQQKINFAAVLEEARETK